MFAWQANIKRAISLTPHHRFDFHVPNHYMVSTFVIYKKHAEESQYVECGKGQLRITAKFKMLVFFSRVSL